MRGAISGLNQIRCRTSPSITRGAAGTAPGRFGSAAALDAPTKPVNAAADACVGSTAGGASGAPTGAGAAKDALLAPMIEGPGGGGATPGMAIGGTVLISFAR